MKKLVLMLALAVAAVAGADIRAVTPVPQNADTNSWWMKRHAQKLERVKAGGSRVVFIGDSITHFWEGNGRAQWEKYFAGAPYHALNLGYSADRTEHVLWRLDHGELDGYEAKAVVLMIGTNNNYGDKPEDIARGIRTLLADIRAKQPQAKILLLPVFPRGERPDDAKRRNNAAVIALIKPYADGENILWLDFTDRLVQGDGTISKDLMPDFLHPREAGYRIWADAALPVFRAVCGK